LIKGSDFFFTSNSKKILCQNKVLFFSHTLLQALQKESGLETIFPAYSFTNQITHSPPNPGFKAETRVISSFTDRLKVKDY